jgi:hypothetical protein
MNEDECILIKNDGKKKPQSFKASFKHSMFTLVGYGATAKEALSDFKIKMDFLIQELTFIDYDNLKFENCSKHYVSSVYLKCCKCGEIIKDESDMVYSNFMEDYYHSKCYLDSK